MTAPADAAAYEQWYHAPRGAWISRTEFHLMMRLLRPVAGATLLEVGSGTGHFSRLFASAGLQVTGLDPDRAMLDYACRAGGGIDYAEGSVLALPFPDRAFDYVTAVTSLCFVSDPQRALAEMWRVCRRTLVLGLLNRHSLLFGQHQGRGSYQGARWDTAADARSWTVDLHPAPRVVVRSAVFFPGGGAAARVAELLLPGAITMGGFLAVALHPFTDAVHGE